MNVVVLSGGVGGARFVRGVVDVVDPRLVAVVGNVGDDLEVLGMHVSPDLDSVLYALAGLVDAERGWGRADETWRALGTVAADKVFKQGDGQVVDAIPAHVLKRVENARLAGPGHSGDEQQAGRGLAVRHRASC